MIASKIEVVTPEKAKEMLRHNLKNRKVKPLEVEALVREIDRGNFYTTHQGIAFDECGDLIDGQHRLFAIVKSGKAVRIMVTTGLPHNAVNGIDRGVSRSTSDILTMADYDGDLREKKLLSNSNIIASINAIVENNYRKLKMQPSEVIEVFNEFKSSIMEVYPALGSASNFPGGAPALAAIIVAAYCGVSANAIKRFVGVYKKDEIEGCEDYNFNIALNWHRQLEKMKVKKMRLDRKKIYLGTLNCIYHFSNNTSVKQLSIPNVPKYNVNNIMDKLFKS